MYISFNSFQHANNGMFRETDKRIRIKHNIQPVETHGVRLPLDNFSVLFF